MNLAVNVSITRYWKWLVIWSHWCFTIFLVLLLPVQKYELTKALPVDQILGEYVEAKAQRNEDSESWQSIKHVSHNTATIH